jgi:hypothetical protein
VSQEPLQGTKQVVEVLGFPAIRAFHPLMARQIVRIAAVLALTEVMVSIKTSATRTFAEDFLHIGTHGIAP